MTKTPRPLEAERLIARARLGGGTFRLMTMAEYEAECNKSKSTDEAPKEPKPL